MEYQEIFLMNQSYVGHPVKRIPTRLCPRDEIAHPNKIIDIIFMPTRQDWRQIKLNEQPAKYKRIEYDRNFYEDVSSSHFYVMAEKTLIFEDARRVNKYNYEDMLSFISKHHANMFVITSPVFRYFTNSNQLDLYYSIPVNTLQQPIFIDIGTFVELRDLIQTRCYTVCNGMTIFLAMVRAKVWSIKDALFALQKWNLINNEQAAFEADDIFNDLWQYLYTNHPIPMIANFPTYYASMYPPVPTTFFEHLEITDSIPLSQFIDDTNPADVKCLYASPITSMLPYFNKAIFDYYNPNFIQHDSYNSGDMFQTPFGLDINDEQQADIEGFILGIIRSRRAWKWWKKHGAIYLRKLWDVNNGSRSFLNYFFQVLFYYYTKPYQTIKYPRLRVRAIWNMAFIIFPISHMDIHLSIASHVIKKTVYDNFNISRLLPTIPMAFLIDVFKYYKNEFLWFNNNKYKLYTRHDTNMMLSSFAPHIFLNDTSKENVNEDLNEDLNENENEYILLCSLYNLLKLIPDYQQFTKYIIDKHIAKKLFCIDKIFGLKEDELSKLRKTSNSDAYIVGILLKDYLRNHRNMLI